MLTSNGVCYSQTLLLMHFDIQSLNSSKHSGYSNVKRGETEADTNTGVGLSLYFFAY